MTAAFARYLQRLWWLPRLTPITWLLAPLAWLVGREAARRRTRFAGGLHAPERLPVPVIVVGNVIVGGAGKTPTVIALVALLRDWGWRPGIVSRGHGRSDAGPMVLDGGEGGAGGDSKSAASALARSFGDEPLLMHRRTGAPVAVARRRRDAAARLLQRQPAVDIVIADDGLQHHALPRDIEIVVFDDRGIGNGWTLPAGPLREPVSALWPAEAARHAGAVPPAPMPPRFVLVNGRWPAPPALPLAAPANRRWEAERSLGGAIELAAWQRGEPAVMATLEGLRGRRLLAAAGIGDPERFFSMLEARGLDIARLPLADHADFEPLPWPATTAEVLVTEKDAVKLAGRSLGATRVWVVTLDFRLPHGLAQALRDALELDRRTRREDHRERPP